MLPFEKGIAIDPFSLCRYVKDSLVSLVWKIILLTHLSTYDDPNI